jgi:hypothetical protein
MLKISFGICRLGVHNSTQRISLCFMEHDQRDIKGTVRVAFSQ